MKKQLGLVLFLAMMSPQPAKPMLSLGAGVCMAIAGVRVAVNGLGEMLEARRRQAAPVPAAAVAPVVAAAGVAVHDSSGRRSPSPLAGESYLSEDDDVFGAHLTQEVMDDHLRNSETFLGKLKDLHEWQIARLVVTESGGFVEGLVGNPLKGLFLTILKTVDHTYDKARAERCFADRMPTEALAQVLAQADALSALLRSKKGLV